MDSCRDICEASLTEDIEIRGIGVELQPVSVIGDELPQQVKNGR